MICQKWKVQSRPKKKNPFSNFGDFDQTKIESIYIPKKEEIVKDGDNIIYTVMPGDTLYASLVLPFR